MLVDNMILEPGKAVLLGICIIYMMMGTCRGNWAYGRYVADQ